MTRLFDDPVDVNGVKVWQDALDRTRQEALLADIRGVARAAPPRSYETPGGRKMSVAMTAAGDLGWMSDRSGYRYAPLSPEGGRWPEIPDSVIAIWRAYAGESKLPDSCLVNFYGEGAKMGMHQDKDEAGLNWPVLSISLGDDALFRVGQVERQGSTKSIWLKSGDVALLSGDARLAYHGIDRIKFGSSDLLPKFGRLNLTLRIAGQRD